MLSFFPAGMPAACNLTLAPLQVASEFCKKWQWGKLNKTVTSPARQVMFLAKPKSHLCLTEWRGTGKCRWGKSTLGAACPAQKIMFCNLCCTLACSLRFVHYLFWSENRANIPYLFFQVDYDNHPLMRAKSKKGSPVRIFTNIDAAKIKLPASEGYR